MDMSQEYIDMCNVDEIQKIRDKISRFEDGDVIVSLVENWEKTNDSTKIRTLDTDDIIYYRKLITNISRIDLIIWLPRQDQLQDMIKIKQNWQYSYHYQHYDEIDTMLYEEYYDKQPFDTYEKLWLAYVMWKNYGKVWIEGEWIEKGKYPKLESTIVAKL